MTDTKQATLTPVYIVKLYDPQCRVAPYYRTERDTWNKQRSQARQFETERDACDFIAQWPEHYAALDFCVEVA